MSGVGEHGQGTIIELQNGRFQVAVTMADGRRVWRRARTPREAERKRKKLIEQREADIEPSRQTLADFLRSWISGLRDAKRQRIRPRTLDHYAMIVERHIIPALGGRRLDAISERHIQAWLDADPSAPRTISHHRAVLRRALNIAVRQRLIPRNPAIAIDLPDASWHGERPLTLDEGRALLSATAQDRLGPLYRLALDSGLRQAELLGLGWDDVDLDEGSVTVTTQLQRIDGAWKRTPTKAARLVDAVAIAPQTVDVLRAHQLRQASERQADWRFWGLVFVTSNGEPYHGSEILKAFKAACLRAGIEPRRFHDLRGSTATLMRELGIPEDVRMARLGHSTKAMARHYAKARDGLDRDAARALGEALRG